jgi:hypothetical protein
MHHKIFGHSNWFGSNHFFDVARRHFNIIKYRQNITHDAWLHQNVIITKYFEFFFAFFKKLQKKLQKKNYPELVVPKCNVDG